MSDEIYMPQILILLYLHKYADLKFMYLGFLGGNFDFFETFKISAVIKIWIIRVLGFVINPPAWAIASTALTGHWESANFTHYRHS